MHLEEDVSRATREKRVHLRRFAREVGGRGGGGGMLLGAEGPPGEGL